MADARARWPHIFTWKCWDISWHVKIWRIILGSIN
jgi:hypothetical protein